jgi:hypothetical protein
VPRPRPARLEIEADLALVVTTPDGRSTTARAVGDGSSLRIETARPDVLLAAVDRADVGPLADVLDAAGVSIYVNGPRGRVAAIGSAASSRFGRILTGSTNTEIQPRAVLARAYGPAAAVAVVAVLVALVGRATRNRAG